MSESKHAPSPWTSTQQHCYPHHEIWDAAGHKIAFVLDHSEHCAGTAAYILRACNSHEALRDACRAAAALLPLACKCNDRGGCAACLALEQVEAAIAKATEGGAK